MNIFHKFSRTLAVVALLLASSCQKNIDEPAPPYIPRPQNATDFNGTAYQLLVYSFADSDGNGIGDFKGIQNHLDYFLELGVSSLWLSPIHPSNAYHAYEVTDYFGVNRSYGTEQDFKDLVDAAAQKGIDIYLDYILNHTGKQHPWFTEAMGSKNSPYRDFYFISNNPTADVAEGKFASIGQNNSGEWTKTGSSPKEKGKYIFTLTGTTDTAPAVSVSSTDADAYAGSSSWNIFYWNDSRSTSTNFKDMGNGTLQAVVDFTGYTGFLIRKKPNWDAGSKFGAPAGKTVIEEDKPLTLVANGADITLSPTNYLYYFSCFSSWMPDLNYGPASSCENSPAFKEIAASADKWINMGVNGLRLDAVKHIYGGISSWDNAANKTFLTKWYQHCNSTYMARAGSSGNLFMVGEVFNEYNDGKAPYSVYLSGLPSVFNFSFWWRLSDALNKGKGKDFASNIISQQRAYASSRPDAVASLKLSNHDEDRAGDVLGRSAAKERQAGAILLTAQGKPFIYQGEELGYYGSKSGGDEYVRTPLNWDGGAWASGKLSGKIISALKGSDYSVATQSADENSVLSTYRKFGKARAEYAALHSGEISAYSGTLPDSFAAWYMTDSQGQQMLVVHNLSGSTATANLSGNLKNIVVQLGEVSVEGSSVTFGANSSAVFSQK